MPGAQDAWTVLPPTSSSPSIICKRAAEHNEAAAVGPLLDQAARRLTRFGNVDVRFDSPRFRR